MQNCRWKTDHKEVENYHQSDAHNDRHNVTKVNNNQKTNKKHPQRDIDSRGVTLLCGREWSLSGAERELFLLSFGTSVQRKSWFCWRGQWDHSSLMLLKNLKTAESCLQSGWTTILDSQTSPAVWGVWCHASILASPPLRSTLKYLTNYWVSRNSDEDILCLPRDEL